jgi:hypothetical protein
MNFLRSGNERLIPFCTVLLRFPVGLPLIPCVHCSFLCAALESREADGWIGFSRLCSTTLPALTGVMRGGGASIGQ